MAEQALQSAVKFPGLSQENFLSDCAAFVALLATARAELDKLGTIDPELDDAIVDLMGDSFNEVVRAVTSRTPSMVTVEAEAVAAILVAYVEISTVLLNKKWSQSEGVLQHVSIILGDGEHLNEFYSKFGNPEIFVFAGRRIPIWPTTRERRRMLLTLGSASLDRRVSLQGRSGVITNFDPEKQQITVQLDPDESATVDVMSSSVELEDLPQDPVTFTKDQNAPFLRWILQPSKDDLLGRWLYLKRVDNGFCVSEDGEKFDVKTLIKHVNASNLKFLSQVPVEVDQALSKVVKVMDDAKDEWASVNAPSARYSFGRSILKLTVLERFLNNNGLTNAIGLLWQTGMDRTILWTLVDRVAENLPAEAKSVYAEQLASAIMAKEFTEQELKTDITEIDLALEGAIRCAAVVLENSDATVRIHSFRLKTWFTLLHSSSLSQRLLGLNRLTNLVILPLSSSSNNPITNAPPDIIDKVRRTSLQFVVEDRVLERVFGEARHLEVVKRSSQLLNFMARIQSVNGGLNSSHLDAIWNAATREEGETMRAIQQLIVELVPIMIDSDLKMTCLTKKLEGMKSDMDERSLDFVHELTLATISDFKDVDHPGISLLWDFILSHPLNKVSQKSVRLGIKLLGESFGEVTTPKRRFASLDQLCKIVAANNPERVPQALLLIRAIVETFPDDDGRSRSLFGSMILSPRTDSRRSVLNHLESKAKLLRTVVSGLETNSAGSVLFGPDEQTQIRLEFISFALRTNPQSKLGEKLVETIWKSCVVNATSEHSAEISLRWFGRAHGAPPSNSTYSKAGGLDSVTPVGALFFSETDLKEAAPRPAFNDEAEQWVLLKGFPTLPRRRWSKLAAQVLVDYFLSCNKKAKMIRFVDDLDPGVVSVLAGLDEDGRIKRVLRTLERISANELLGTEQLWRGCLETTPLNGRYAKDDDKQREADEEVFHVLSSVLCRAVLSTGTLKDVKRVTDLHGAFIQRALSGVEKSNDVFVRRRYIRLLKTFLLRATVSPSETCKIVLLPPLPGTPGSLSRRDERPRSRTGGIQIQVSLGVTLGELRKEIIPRALDYTGSDVVALRLVHRMLDLESLSSASVKFTALPSSLNSRTLRELGFERHIVLQCFEQANFRDTLSIDDDELDDDSDDEDSDDDEDDDERYRFELSDPLLQAYSDATYERLYVRPIPSIEDEIEQACASGFDSDPASFPPKWSAKVQAMDAAFIARGGASDVLKPHVSSLSENILRLLTDLASKLEPGSAKNLDKTPSISRRDLLDLWECFLCVPVQQPDDAPIKLDANVDVKKDLYRTLAVLRTLVAKSDAALRKSTDAHIPKAVLEVLSHMLTHGSTCPRTIGLIFTACYRMLPLFSPAERTTCARLCLDWALVSDSTNQLKQALYLAEKCIEQCDDTGPIADRFENLWTQRLLSTSNTSSNHKVRLLISGSVLRCSWLKSELNVFRLPHVTAVEELLNAAMGAKPDFDVSSSIGQHSRRRVAKSSEALFLYISRLVESCSFDAATTPSPVKLWFTRAVDALMAYTPEDQEERVFVALARFIRGLLLRSDFADVQKEVLEKEGTLARFLAEKCLLGSDRRVSPSAIESALGLLRSLVIPSSRDSPIALQALFDVLEGENALIPTSIANASSKQNGTSAGKRASVSSRRSRLRTRSSFNIYGHGWPIVDVLRFGSLSQKHHLQYAGIGNLGATCYQNSLLQQLFHVTQFSSKLLDVQTTDEVLQSLQVMFASMFVSSETAIETKPFCAVFKDYDGRPISHVEQKDVQEFCDMLFTRLEQASPEIKKLLEETFGGDYIQRTQSLEPNKPYVSDRTDPFYLVQVDIKGKQTLHEALDGLVAKTKLVGENRCELPGGDKVDATVQTLFRRLPPHLMINLKRFEFQYETMSKAKLDDYLSFPLELDLSPYMDRTGNQNPVSDEDCKYELNGILVHSGGADSGHYYSFIRERVARDDRLGRQWYEFNDQIVWPYAEDRIAKDCFGGFDRYPRPNGQFIEIPRSHSAYILMYDRVSVVSKWKNDPLIMFGARLKAGQVTNRDESDEYNAEEDAVSEEEDVDEDVEDDAAVSNGLARGKPASNTLSRRGRPFGSFAVPPALHVKVQPVPATTQLGTSNDAVLFHPMFTKLLQDILEKELRRLSSNGAAKEPDKDLFLAVDVCMLYLIQVLSHTCLQRRRLVLDGFVSALEQATRASFAIAVRVLERLALQADAFVKPMLCECPSRALRRRFAELILLCFEACIVQGPALSESTALSQVQDQSLEVPVAYLQSGEVPSNRALWIFDALFTLAEESAIAVHNSVIPTSEFSALLTAMVRVDPQIKAHATKRKYFKTALDLLVKRSLRVRSGSKPISIRGAEPPGLAARRLAMAASQPACELALVLADQPDTLTGERFLEASLRLMDFSSCVQAASLLFPNLDTALSKIAERALTSANSESVGLLSDFIRTYHSALDAEKVQSLVDDLVSHIQTNVASEGPFEDTVHALRSLGVAVAHSKRAADHMRQAQKKALSTWPKDFQTYIRNLFLEAVEAAKSRTSLG